MSFEAGKQGLQYWSHDEADGEDVHFVMLTSNESNQSKMIDSVSDYEKPMILLETSL